MRNSCVPMRRLGAMGVSVVPQHGLLSFVAISMHSARRLNTPVTSGSSLAASRSAWRRWRSI
eukprot:243048-Prymnesium_polylepis.1